MITNIISIGNSHGIRIPKPLLEESGIGKTVELKAKKGEIRIVSLPTKKISTESSILSEKVLAMDWDRPEEDNAWKSLQ
ncbi:MAG: hypothetical protein A3A51_01185 [Candidatus Levybacteria bacterium RIFCSPLOWO2_01_FULL_39_10]|nr:MAG: hypothetical protein A3A51_01185 [Candidatus Levybacteria bacterium RIFCSPLOWO2_01_FULL_39_10]